MAAKKQPKHRIVNTPVYGANLRADPDGRILETVLPNGAPVEVAEERDGWAKVDGGWIRAKYLA